VARIVVLDAWPLGLASDAKGKPEADRCRAGIDHLVWSRVLVIAPEIVDFEVRRELLRTGATAGIRRLDGLISKKVVIYAPITTAAMRLAAAYWAQARQAGLPTASDLSLDADCIVAGQAAAVCGHGDVMTIATRNPSHLARFPGIDARQWENITP
jgi:hypothetical protein